MSGCGRGAEIAFIDKLGKKSEKKKYFNRAERIGFNAVRLVNDFFTFGIRDDVINYKSKFPFVDSAECKWSIGDLDRALKLMENCK